MRQIWIVASIAIVGFSCQQQPAEQVQWQPIVFVPHFDRQFALEQPAESTSPSGRYSIQIVSETKGDGGKGTCYLSLDGKPVLEKGLPYSFSEVWINDEGTFGGYAYTQGYDGYGRRSQSEPGGKLILAIYDKEGVDVASKEIARYLPEYHHASVSPRVDTSRVFAGNHDVLLLLSGDGRTEDVSGMWRLDLKGRRVEKFVIGPEGLSRSAEEMPVAFEPISGTPYVLGHWCNPYKSSHAEFVMFDRNGMVLWSEIWEDDYANPKDVDKLFDAVSEMGYRGAIVAVAQSRFMLRSIAKDALVEYKVAGNKVSEVRRQKYSEEAVPKPKRTFTDWSSVPVRNLNVAATLAAKTPQTLFEGGRVLMQGPADTLVVLKSKDKTLALVQIDRSGSLIKTIEIKPEQGDRYSSVACAMDKGRYAVVVRPPESKDSQIWVIDLESEKQLLFAEIKDRAVDKLGWSEGRMVLLGSIFLRYTIEEFLTVLDHNGTKVWDKVQSGSSGDPSELFSPEDIVVRGEEIFVLNNIADYVSVYRLDNGRFLRTYDLESLWGKEPSYVTDLKATKDGYVVGDSDVYFEVGPDFKVRSKHSVRFASGQGMFVYDGPLACADGTKWVLAEDSVHLLDESYKVTRSIGGEVPESGLSQVYQVTTDGRDRVYVSDFYTGSVFVCDPALGVTVECRPLPEDFHEYPADADFQVSSSGHVFVTSIYKDRFVEFAQDGKRVAARPEGLAWEYKGQYDLFPDSRAPNSRWFRRLLLDVSGNVLASVDRRIDKHWLSGGFVEAPDGSLMNWDVYGDAYSCSFHSPTGVPLAMAKFQVSVDDVRALGYDGRYVYVVMKNQLVAIGQDGKPRWRANWPEGVAPIGFGGVLSDGSVVVWQAEGVFVLKG
ncbi:MAG: hypothetical protein WD716_13570 [Fimbriimonadaceae bacterium]